MNKNSRLPEYLNDAPPIMARRIETARNKALQWLFAHSYQLIIPPLVEYAESLTANDEDLSHDIFKMTDTLSGQTLGIRADHTPQTARFDAAINSDESRRLCYCGPALRTRPAQPWKQREIMQLGAEIFNAPSSDADWEILYLANGTLTAIGVKDIAITIGHAGLIHLLLGEEFSDNERAALYRHFSRQDTAILADKIGARARSLIDLLNINGDIKKAYEIVRRAGLGGESMLDNIAATVAKLQMENVDIAIDFSEIGGYGYHTGMVFSLYAGSHVAARGGRYDRNGYRPAVGFSIDLREIASLLPAPDDPRIPISCPPPTDDLWFKAIAKLHAENRPLRFISESNPPAPALEKSDNGWKVKES